MRIGCADQDETPAPTTPPHPVASLSGPLRRRIGNMNGAGPQKGADPDSDNIEQPAEATRLLT